MGLDNITAIDDLPYTRKKDTTTPEYRRAIRSHVGNIIYAKRPSVILCMSQEKEEIPSPTALLKSLGIGKTFRDPIIRLGTDHYAKRINAFHPSYALYHRMNDSAFRQLLLLEVTRTCGELRGDWKEEGWMQDLRRDCQAKARQAQSDVRVQLMSSLEAIKSLLIELLSVEKDSARAISRLLMNMRASEHCNDASLCLSDIDARYGAIHPDDRDDDLVSLAAFTVSACKDFLVRVLRGIKGTQLLLANRRAQATGIYTKESVHSVTRTSSAALTGRMQLGDDIQLFLQNLNGSFTWTHAGTRSCAAIEELSRLFLSLAIAFEAQLGRLTLASSGNQIPNPSTEQDLALDFSRLTVR
ncbi:hypothetical protein LTR72_011399 [Exophiala xenobiotica]|nr:hypothetical protein LTR92_011183 [Exophiala xenobiotica]KAK5215548.1 hypothetical protein LTR72_011399 [Exophiala xenobiotica]KAK5284876.1 hypothetical protein LTR14_011429 [Exophiala xenobiotica]KAK5311841.1 hypothetical protein LTR93_011571 [Exophiala xenobiotica]KAK5463804.1 hypothetical protein LTR55_011804 [Exophiala xenobiotica]